MDNGIKLREGLTEDLEQKAKYFKTPSLEDVEVEEEDLVSPDEEEYEKGTAYKRAVLEKHDFNLGIYPDKSLFLQHLHSSISVSPKGKLKWGKSGRIIRETLNVGGVFRHNEMEEYLNQDNVTLDGNGQLKTEFQFQ